MKRAASNNSCGGSAKAARNLCSFCQKRNLTPEQYAELTINEIDDTAQDYVNALEGSTLEDGKS